MKIDNAIESGKYKIYFALSFIVFVIPLVFIFIEEFNWIYAILSALGLIIYIYLWAKNPNYINFETTHRSIILRYYHTHPFLRKPKLIEIPLDNFKGYEIVKKGLGKKIILKIKQGKKTGKFPAVSLSIVPEKDIEKMLKELDTILKIKNLK